MMLLEIDVFPEHQDDAYWRLELLNDLRAFLDDTRYLKDYAIRIQEQFPMIVEHSDSLTG